MPVRENDKWAWIREALAKRKYKAKDLARAWGISESSTSRFLSGEELQDPPLSRAATLASMLGISIDELAKGMGYKGAVVIPNPSIQDFELPLNTYNMNMLGGGQVRLTFCQDLPAEKVAKITAILAA